MRNIILTIIFSCLIVTSKAQDISIEKYTFGTQIGIVGIWIYNEAKLTKSLALRSEFGLGSGFG